VKLRQTCSKECPNDGLVLLDKWSKDVKALEGAKEVLICCKCERPVFFSEVDANMDKAKWRVVSKYATKKEVENYYREDGEDPDDFGIAEFNGVEISIVREDYKLGIDSHGWDGLDKIILLSSEGESDFTKEDIEWAEKVAQVMCNVLNEKGL